MDCFSRKVLAWRISITLEVEFCFDALNEAIHKFGPPKIMNADQGSHFTFFDWTNRLKRAKTKISMDNIFIKRFWRSLKYECVYLHASKTGSQAKAGVGRWITFYNHQRPHAAHGGIPPAVVFFNAIEIYPRIAEKLTSSSTTRSANTLGTECCRRSPSGSSKN